jgi:integrase
MGSGEDRKVSRQCRSDAPPSLGLALLLAANLGQRQGYVLRLAWSQYNGEEITLSQGKTSTLITVPVTRELNAALARTPKRAPTIVVCETTGRPYKSDHFRHEFRRILYSSNLRIAARAMGVVRGK